jgi:hypothetical protein
LKNAPHQLVEQGKEKVHGDQIAHKQTHPSHLLLCPNKLVPLIKTGKISTFKQRGEKNNFVNLISIFSLAYA